MKTHPSVRIALISFLAVWLLGACAGSSVPGVYRIDIQQGNIVTEDMLKRIEPGMDRRKVRFILGTPLIADTFNEDRWDYLYTFQRGRNQRVQRRISVLFEDDQLKQVIGDIQLAVQREAAPIRNDKVIDVVGPREPDTIFASLNPFKDDEPEDEGKGVWDTLTGSDRSKRIIKRKVRATPETAQATVAAAKSAGDGSGNSDGAPATVNAVEPVPRGDGQPLPAPGSVAATLNGAETPAEPAATDNGESAGDGTTAPGFWDRLTGSSTESDATAPEAAESTTTPAPPRSTMPSATPSVPVTPAGTTNAANEAPSAAETAEAEPAKSGGLFDRIRDRFELRDNVDSSSFLEIKPPPEDTTEDR
jgi:outer membrane protein assembly factor BamE